MITTNPVDKVIGGLVGALAVHGAHKDFHSAFMVILALGQVRPLVNLLSADEEEDWLRGEKVAVRCRILFHGHELDRELEEEFEFRFHDLVQAWDSWDASNYPHHLTRYDTLIQMDEIIMACPVAGRIDLVKGSMPEIERLFLFNHVDQAEVSKQVGEFLQNNPRDGKWGDLLKRIAKAKETLSLAKAVMGR